MVRNRQCDCTAFDMAGQGVGPFPYPDLAAVNAELANAGAPPVSDADFRTFERHGVVFCPENKDVVLFPETISGAFAALHRPVCGTG